MFRAEFSRLLVWIFHWYRWIFILEWYEQSKPKVFSSVAFQVHTFYKFSNLLSFREFQYLILPSKCHFCLMCNSTNSLLKILMVKAAQFHFIFSRICVTFVQFSWQPISPLRVSRKQNRAFLSRLNWAWIYGHSLELNVKYFFSYFQLNIHILLSML